MRKHILIADDDPDLVDLLCRRCESIGLEVDTAANAMSALGKAEETLPDAVILDVEMPYGNGLSVCEMMADHAELARIPVIVMTGAKCKETIRRCHQLCAYYVPKGPDLWGKIEPVLRDVLPLDDAQSGADAAPATLPPVRVDADLLRRRPTPERMSLVDAAFEMIAAGNPVVGKPQNPAGDTHPPWALSIDDDEDVSHLLALRFTELGIDVIRAAAGRDGYRQAFFNAPSLIILDYELPEGNGDYVLRRLKESPATAEIPVIVLTGRREPTVENQMRRLGADDFFHKPFEWDRLRDAVVRLSPDAVEQPVAVG